MAELGECPAALDASFDGINSGKNAGRICWAVAGTCCGGEVQGTYAEKRDSCIGCNFYQMVQEEEGISPADHKFINYFADGDDNPILQKLTCKTFAPGQRIVRQGEVRDKLLIVHRGACLVLVEKNGEMHPVGHRGRGDVLGSVSFLTGEPQTAHIEAETDIQLWELDRNLFENIHKEHPELLDFFTEIVADQFDSKRPVADRAIGKYLATDIIGRGGFSIVYKGMHTGLNMPVAIKMLRHHLAMDVDFQESFRKEAHTIANMDHENIIKIYDIEERFRTMFIIEELVSGESLKALLKRLGKIPVKLATHFLLQICSGLAYAHQAGIIHRDINPTNIYVKQNDQIKILDFGLACPIGTEDFASMGNIAYMAPEQIESEPLHGGTDIYALGLTAFEMVIGRQPYQADDVRELARMHLECDIPDLAIVAPDIPEALRGFIQTCCQRNPEDRYQRIGDAAVDLKHLAEEIGLDTREPPAEKFHMASLLMAYNHRQEAQFREFMDQIRSKARELGIVLKSTELNDL